MLWSADTFSATASEYRMSTDRFLMQMSDTTPSKDSVNYCFTYLHLLDLLGFLHYRISPCSQFVQSRFGLTLWVSWQERHRGCKNCFSCNYRFLWTLVEALANSVTPGPRPKKICVCMFVFVLYCICFVFVPCCLPMIVWHDDRIFHL